MGHAPVGTTDLKVSDEVTDALSAGVVVFCIWQVRGDQRELRAIVNDDAGASEARQVAASLRSLHAESTFEVSRLPVYSTARAWARDAAARQERLRQAA